MTIVTTAQQLQDAVSDEGGPPHVHITEHLDLSDLGLQPYTESSGDEREALLVVAPSVQSITVHTVVCVASKGVVARSPCNCTARQTRSPPCYLLVGCSACDAKSQHQELYSRYRHCGHCLVAARPQGNCSAAQCSKGREAQCELTTEPVTGTGAAATALYIASTCPWLHGLAVRDDGPDSLYAGVVADKNAELWLSYRRLRGL